MKTQSIRTHGYMSHVCGHIRLFFSSINNNIENIVVLLFYSFYLFYSFS